MSTRGCYGTRAMLDLALNYGEGPILVKDIARNQEISERYLEHLLISLKLAGMVRSSRGRRGGFTLAKPPHQIKFSEIIQAMEGSVAAKECVDDSRVCSRAVHCVTRDILIQMQRMISNLLASTTLHDLVEQQAEKKAATKVSSKGYKVVGESRK